MILGIFNTFVWLKSNNSNGHTAWRPTHGWPRNHVAESLAKQESMQPRARIPWWHNYSDRWQTQTRGELPTPDGSDVICKCQIMAIAPHLLCYAHISETWRWEIHSITVRFRDLCWIIICDNRCVNTSPNNEDNFDPGSHTVYSPCSPMRTPAHWDRMFESQKGHWHCFLGVSLIIKALLCVGLNIQGVIHLFKWRLITSELIPCRKRLEKNGLT